MAMASNLLAMASHLEAMASNLIGTASNLVVRVSTAINHFSELFTFGGIAMQSLSNKSIAQEQSMLDMKLQETGERERLKE